PAGGGGGARPGGPPGAPQPAAPRPEEEPGAETRLVTGDRRGYPGDPATHHQDVRPGERDDASAAPELGPLPRGELITPDSSVFDHASILRDRVTVQHHIGPQAPGGPADRALWVTAHKLRNSRAALGVAVAMRL